MNDKQKFSGSRITFWIGVISSVFTIILTVGNGILKIKIDAAESRFREEKLKIERIETSLKQKALDAELIYKQADARLKEFDASLKERAQKIEESKEKINRYAFVQTLLPDLLTVSDGQDTFKQVITINLIKLTLTPEEAARLFEGFKNSQETILRNVGLEGLKVINEEKNASQKASEKEREGFQYLIKRKYKDAIKSFSAADTAFSGFHQAFEISNLLKREEYNLAQVADRYRVLQLIVNKYAWHVPEDLIESVQQTIKKERMERIGVWNGSWIFYWTNRKGEKRELKSPEMILEIDENGGVSGTFRETGIRAGIEGNLSGKMDEAALQFDGIWENNKNKKGQLFLRLFEENKIIKLIGNYSMSTVIRPTPSERDKIWIGKKN